MAGLDSLNALTGNAAPDASFSYGAEADGAKQFQDAMDEVGPERNSSADAVQAGVDGARAAGAHDGTQLAQVVVPGVPLPLPIPPSATPDAVPAGWVQSLQSAAERAGRRAAYIGGEIAQGDLPGAAGHALLGQPFPLEVDDPFLAGVPQALPMATPSQGQPQFDTSGRPISQRAVNMPPPGDCTPGEQKRLQADVTQACKTTPLSCNANMSQAELWGRTDQNMACGTARDRINNKCFAGGNRNHRNEATKAWTGAANCRAYLP